MSHKEKDDVSSIKPDILYIKLNLGFNNLYHFEFDYNLLARETKPLEALVRQQGTI